MSKCLAGRYFDAFHCPILKLSLIIFTTYWWILLKSVNNITVISKKKKPHFSSFTLLVNILY